LLTSYSDSDTSSFYPDQWLDLLVSFMNIQKTPIQHELITANADFLYLCS
jgi:hypothetical protein